MPPKITEPRAHPPHNPSDVSLSPAWTTPRNRASSPRPTGTNIDRKYASPRAKPAVVSVLLAEEAHASGIRQRAAAVAVEAVRRIELRHEVDEPAGGGEQDGNAGPDVGALEHLGVERSERELGELLARHWIPVAVVAAREAGVAVGREDAVEPQVLRAVVERRRPTGVLERRVVLHGDAGCDERGRRCKQAERDARAAQVEMSAARAEHGQARGQLRTAAERDHRVARRRGRGADVRVVVGARGVVERIGHARVV